MRYCIFCGAEIPPSAAFCQICGKAQPDGIVAGAADDEADEVVQPKNFLEKILASPKNMALAGAAIFVVLLIIFTAILMLAM